MQYNREIGSYEGGKTYALTMLPKPSVDTGMGLERVAAVLQGVTSNYDTDLFIPLMKRAAELCGVNFDKEIQSEAIARLVAGTGGAASLRVIADHSRATTFLIADGVLPSNEGRGYVLRKIIRRAIRHGRLLGAKEPFLHEMVHSVASLMSDAYPELSESEKQVSNVVHGEELRFARTLDLGLSKLDDLLTKFRATIQAGSIPTVPQRTLPSLGIEAFKLFDTFGLPIDFIRDAARDLGVPFDKVDEADFEQVMQEQRTRARASWKGGAKEAANPAYAKLAETFKTEPDFYFGTCAKDCRIEAIITKLGAVSELNPGESGEVVLDRTAIYAESGGQVADTGAFYDASESQQLAEVKGAFYPVAGLVAHRVLAKETLRVGDRVTVVTDAERRARIIRNHSGTHLVHAALRNILGTHVKQAGSLNAPERLRFDFSHFAHVDAEELRDIEQQVNDEIRLNTQIETNVTSLDNALASGALAFFGDKYPESNVRVVTIPDPRSPRGF
jgi:alanyl-tRNA synthetase